MRKISSPNAFKTCYIADIKEKMGFPVRVASNREGKTRKIKCPDSHAKFIVEAIKKLQKEGKKLTYKNIQETAFEIYKKNMDNKKVNKYFGSIRAKNNFSDEYIEDIINSEVFEFET